MIPRRWPVARYRYQATRRIFRTAHCLTVAADRDLTVEIQLGDVQVGAKGAADGDQADALEAGGIERCLQPVRRKGFERKINRAPALACFKLGAVGLPSPNVVWRAYPHGQGDKNDARGGSIDWCVRQSLMSNALRTCVLSNYAGTDSATD